MRVFGRYNSRMYDCCVMNESRDVPVAASDVRQRFAEHLDRVRAGETFTIYRHGRATAQLGPIEERNSDDE
jgi:prevent-host-death family protein